MVRTILAILSGLVVVVRQVMEALERRRLAEEREAQRVKDEEHLREIERLEENPSEWFSDHFSGSPAERVHQVSDMPSPSAAAPEADADSRGQ